MQCNRLAESDVDEILRQHSECAASMVDKERDCFVNFDPVKSRVDILIHEKEKAEEVKTVELQQEELLLQLRNN